MVFVISERDIFDIGSDLVVNIKIYLRRSSVISVDICVFNIKWYFRRDLIREEMDLEKFIKEIETKF